MDYLVITLMFLFVVAFLINKKEIMAPAVLFSGVFLFSSVWAWLNKDRWSLVLDSRTYWIIVCGVFVFILVSYLCNRMALRFFSFDIKENALEENPVGRDKSLAFKSIVLAGIEILGILLIVMAVKKATGISNLSAAIKQFNYSSNGFIEKRIRLPLWANLYIAFNFSIAMFMGYLFIKELLFHRHFSISILFPIVFGFVTPLLTGSRGGTMTIVIAFASFFFFLMGQKSGWNGKHNFKLLLLIIIASLLILVIFQYTATLVGRNVSNFNLFDYLSIYLGAEIKNLDIFIRSNSFPVRSDIFGRETFVNILPTVYKIFGQTPPVYHLNLPFRYVNGYSLGNVYTLFYPWLEDFGYTGYVILTCIMASITQLVYSFAHQASSKQRHIPISILLYGYFASSIALSFFSNKFFERISSNLLVYILCWILLNYYFFLSPSSSKEQMY